MEFMGKRRKAEEDPSCGPIFVWRAFRDPLGAGVPSAASPKLDVIIGRFSVQFVDRLGFRPQEVKEVSDGLPCIAHKPAPVVRGACAGEENVRLAGELACRKCRKKAGVCTRRGAYGHLPVRAPA